MGKHKFSWSRLSDAKVNLLLIILGISLLLNLIGCEKKSSPESAVESFLGQKRNEYAQVDIEKISDGVPLIGINPSDIVLAIFGMKDDVEGNFREELTTEMNNSHQMIVTLRQMGLADDSVQGIRYRLEFIPQDEQWHLVWAGRQQICWPGRGSQDWTIEGCL